MNEFARPTGIQWSGPGYGVAQYGDDSKLLVMFYTKSILNAVKSRQSGRPINEDQTYIKIQHPGEHLNIIDRPAFDADKIRFANQWSAYLHNQTQVPEGTPIDLLFPNFPATAANLRALGVHTVEQCANLSAHAMDSIGMGAQQYKDKAEAYLKHAKEGVNFHDLEKKLTTLSQEKKLLEQQVVMQRRQIDDLVARFSNPLGSNPITNPGFQPGFDAQAERINANHPTVEIMKQVKVERPAIETAANTLDLDELPNI